MATQYAWSNIEGSKDGETVRVPVGEKVTASALGLSDDEFKELQTVGAVRPFPVPDMGDFPGSPIEFAKAQLNAMATAEGYVDTQYGRVDRVGTDELPDINPETGRPFGTTQGEESAEGEVKPSTTDGNKK